jgi:hypothetical protein
MILYALNEFIFKASDNGQLYIDAKYNKVILSLEIHNCSGGCATKE